jgi:hypothetical protein
MNINICFDLTVAIQNKLRSPRPHVQVIEENEVEVVRTFNQLRNIYNNTNTKNIQNNQNNQNNLLSESENIDKMEIDFFIKLTLYKVNKQTTD